MVYKNTGSQREWNFCASLQENGRGSGPDLLRNGLSQLEEGNVSKASGSSTCTAASAKAIHTITQR